MLTSPVDFGLSAHLHPCPVYTISKVQTSLLICADASWSLLLNNALNTKILEPNSVVKTINGIIHCDMGLSVARAFQRRNLAVWSCDQNAPYF